MIDGVTLQPFDPVEAEKIEKLYEMHKGKKFYPYLMDLFKGKPVKAFLLGEREGACYQGGFYTDFLALVGDTDPAKALPGTIRSLSKDSIAQSLSERRAVKNLVHRSTTQAETEKEAAIFFWDYIYDCSKVAGEQRALGKLLAQKGDGIFYEERLESGLRKCRLISSDEALITYQDLDGQEDPPAKVGGAVVETTKNGVPSTREITLQFHINRPLRSAS